MSLAFDTSILIALERNDKYIMKKLEDLSIQFPLTPQLPFFSYFEFLVGIKLRRPKNQENTILFFNRFKILHTTNNLAKILSELKIKYDQSGVPLSLSDLFIASQVIENQSILVTRDKDFEKIEELKKIIL
ncbi:MAG: type II toxin-antitoxin system VapC family toxin [Nanoarchaeota archaeon]